MHEGILHKYLNEHGRNAHTIDIHRFGQVDAELEVIAHHLFLHMDVPLHKI